MQNTLAMKLQVRMNIKREVENVFGRQIVSSRDCIQLSNAIYTKTTHQLNANTLRRFFGLIKTDHAPSRATLEILSKYCGFYSVTDLAEEKQADEVQSDLLAFMVSLFRDVPVDSHEDKTFLSVVFNTVSYLNRSPALARQFQVQVAKTTNGQEFYFEKFVNIDKLNSYYGDGMRYYYAEKKTGYAQVFMHSLMVLRYWLTENGEMLLKHFDMLLRNPPDETLEPFMHGRYLAAQILHAHFTGQPVDAIVSTAYTYYLTLPEDKAHVTSPRFELYLSEALILTGHTDQAMLFIEEARKNDSKEDQYNHWKFYQNFLLLETIAACRQKEFDKAESLFKEINPAQFYFLRRSFSNILYLHIIQQLKRHNPKHNEQLNKLIRETGFTQLRHLF